MASAPEAASAVASPQAPAFAHAIADIALRWAEHSDELRDLDAVLGDGDLGITVSAGAAAVIRALDEAQVSSLSEPLRIAGRAFATANPSTFAALFGGGLLAAADALRDERTLTPQSTAAALGALAGRIAERGGARLGDKTILDALLPSIDALATAPGAAAGLAAAQTAAWAGVRATTDSVSQRGRAAWVGERGAGHADPGATAYARLLDAVAASGLVA